MSIPKSDDSNPGLEIFQTSVSKAFYMIRLLLPPTRTIFRHPHVKDARSPEYFSFSIKKDNPLFFQNPQGQSHIQKSRVALLLKHQRSEEHTSELQSRGHLVCRLLLEKKSKAYNNENQEPR